MNVMTKRGTLDNVVTFEHYCDTKADLANIPEEQITLGSIAIVIQDEDEELGAYIADSNKVWHSILSNNNENSNFESESSSNDNIENP